MTATSTIRIGLLLAALLHPYSASAAGLFEEAVSGSQKEQESSNESAATAGLAGKLGGFGFELNGYARGVIYIGKVSGKNATESKTGYGEAALKLRARKGSWGDAFVELRFRAGLEGGETGYVTDLREAYVNAYLGPLDLRVGHQIISWGRADSVNPTNNLTPRDQRLRSPVGDDQRLANFGIRAHLNLDPLRLELVGLPFYKATRLPFDLSGASSPIDTAGLPPGITLELEPAIEPNSNINNGIAATRLHLLLPAFEASLSYLIGTSTRPGLRMRRSPPNAAIALSTFRHHVIGADVSTALAGFGVRGEVAYRAAFDDATREDTPNPELSYVVGLDRELFGELTAIVQYSGKVVFDWLEVREEATRLAGADVARLAGLTLLEPQNRLIFGQLARVQHAITMRLGWKALQQTLELEVAGMYNVTTEELFLRPKASYAITDALSAAAGADLYIGPQGTLFGAIQSTFSAGFAELRASF